MARTEVEVQETYTEIATGRATITIAEAPTEGILFINDAASDTAAEPFKPTDLKGQVRQNANVSTYARATKPGFVLFVDEN